MKLAWFKFKPEAWRSDPSLRMCSLAARGLWIEMLALMHEAEPRGHLLVQGRSVSAKQIASLAGCSSKAADEAILELEQAGVFSKTDEGTIFSRRMVRDTEKAQKDHANGKGGGNPRLKEGVNPGVNGVDKAKNLEERGKKDNSLTAVRPKRVRTKIDYPEKFELLWKAFPTDALMSKNKAFAAWQKLSDDDQDLVLESVPAFRAYCQSHSDYRPVHLVRYITERRFDGFASLEKQVSSSVFVKHGTPQWRAWEAYWRAKEGRGPPCVGEGWRFPTEWPPLEEAHAA